MTGGTWRVLCIDDEKGNAEEVGEILGSWKGHEHGTFVCTTETSMENAVERLSRERFDLVTLDVHAPADPDPALLPNAAVEQAGERVLRQLKLARFIPVIFYTGFADKVAAHRSPVVRIVQKGHDDLQGLRTAVTEIFATQIPQLTRHLENEQRGYIWQTLSQEWSKFEREIKPDELAYFVARRISAGLSGPAVKSFLAHDPDTCAPIEMYLYPPIGNGICPGDIVNLKGNQWLVLTPACDLAQKKTEQILLAKILPLTEHPRHRSYFEAKAAGATKLNEKRSQLKDVLRNRVGERWRYLPATFFIADSVVDFQTLLQIPVDSLTPEDRHCSLDSPHAEAILGDFARYYGRIGVPDLEIDPLLARIAPAV